MRKITAAVIAVFALALAGTAAAALSPSVYIGPGVSPTCATATYSDGVLHLAKPCSSDTQSFAGADITGFTGQSFTAASFTLSSSTVCNGGSPRFDVQMSDNTIFFLGCNNVTPTVNADGSKTYTFSAATLAAAGQQVPFPTGTIKAVDVGIDIMGTADVSRISFNGVAQVPATTPAPGAKNDCKHDGWKTFTNPSFRNQGQCVSYFEHQAKGAHKESKDQHKKHHGKGHAKHHG
jgi:hypothetical protein